MQIQSWAMKERMKGAVHLQSQEEQICYILHAFEELFQGDKISFFRFSPVGFVGEGVAFLEKGELHALAYIRDDIRNLPVIRQAVEKKKPVYYKGQDIITQITSRYQRDVPLNTLLVVPLVANNMTIAYICSEYIIKDFHTSSKLMDDLFIFGKISGELLIQIPNHSHPKLSPRESEILKALANGLSTKEMAMTLSLSEATIKQYIKSILTKLDAKNRAHAVSIYMTLNQ
nr:helix-turn-helix transcriptional regulator [Lysinibacillus timonensis]